MDQTRPLKLPEHVKGRAHTMMQRWSDDPKAPRWMNALEHKLCTPGARACTTIAARPASAPDVSVATCRSEAACSCTLSSSLFAALWPALHASAQTPLVLDDARSVCRRGRR